MDIDFDIAPDALVLNSTDSFDEVVLPAAISTTTVPAPGKFKPKPRGKAAKPIAHASQPISTSSDTSNKLVTEEDANKPESLGSFCRAVHEEAQKTKDETQVPEGERTSQTDNDKALPVSSEMESCEDAYSQSCTTADVALPNSVDCLDEDFLPPATAMAQALGKFQLKRHGKSTKPGFDAPPSVTYSSDPLDIFVPEGTVDRPEPLGSKAVACNLVQEEVLQTEDRNLGLDNPDVCEGEKSWKNDSDVSEEALPVSAEMESRDDICLQACSGGDLVVPISTDCTDDFFHLSDTGTGRALVKFQPKRRGKTTKLVTDAPPSLTSSLDPLCILVTEKIVDQPEPLGSKDVACNSVQEEILRTEDENLGQENSLVSEEEIRLENDSDKLEEAMPVLLGMESCDDIFSEPSAIAVKKVGKFYGNSVSRPKERKKKSVSFVLPDAVETAAYVETHPKFHGNSLSRPKERKKKSVSFVLPDTAESAANVETHPMVLDGHLTGEDSFAPITSSEFLDKIPCSTSILSDNVEFKLDDGRLESQELADLSGLESFDRILDEPITLSEQSVGRFQPKPSVGSKRLTSDASGHDHNAKESTFSECNSFPMNADSLESLSLSDAFESPIHLDEHANTVEISILESGSTELTETSESVDQTTDRNVLVKPSTSKASEDHEASKSLRKTRKRTNICSPDKRDGGASEGLVDENSGNSQMDVDNNDDESCGEMPKQKAPRRSKKQKKEAQEPTQRRKRAPKEPDSAKTEPPKKRFPHGTRRRRQVDKVLLETPDYEIDPKQLKIKDLIMLAEAKERIASKGGEPLWSNQSETGAFSNFFDPDNLFDEDPEFSIDEEHRNILRNSKKLNYHTYMNKPQSGRWSKSETELFFKAIREFGTDFAMIQQLFPNRTRHQVKLKFKNEERKHPKELADAITHRSQDLSHFEQVIQQLQAKADEEARLDDDIIGDPTNLSHGGTNEKQQEQGEAEKEEPKTNDFDGEADNSEKFSEREADQSEKYDDWNGDLGTEEYTGFEDLDWGQ